MRNQGLPDHVFDGRPVIGICNTWSELTPCNTHFRQIAEHVKRGVWESGGFPLEFPVMSLGETNMRPTAMLFRNLVSMDVEESIRANPIDGVVLLCGCDKTTPSLVMGAASCDVPALVVSGGPMLNGKYRGQRDVSVRHPNCRCGNRGFRLAEERGPRGNSSLKAPCIWTLPPIAGESRASRKEFRESRLHDYFRLATNRPESSHRL